MEIPKQLHKEIIEYCKLNSIENVDKFILQTLISGFTIAKYGIQPNTIKEEKTDVIVKTVEKPVTPKVSNKTKIKDDLYGEG